jgi:hypothetical protein
MSVKQTKRGRGRPKNQPKSAAELRLDALAKIHEAKKRCLEITDDVLEETYEVVQRLNGKFKFSRSEMDYLRNRVEFFYQDYLNNKAHDEAEANKIVNERMRKEALDNPQPSSKQMTSAEWNEAHGLRADGSKKRGPAPKKKKTIYDIAPGERGLGEAPAEPVDIDAIEAQVEAELFERHIEEQKKLPPLLRNRRNRHTNHQPARDISKKSFWY